MPSFDTIVFTDGGSDFDVISPDSLVKEYESQNMEFTAAEAGIPAVFFSYETDTKYHTDEDKIEYISESNLENIAKIAAEMTYDMAEAPRLQSTQGFNGTVNQYRHANPNKEIK